MNCVVVLQPHYWGQQLLPHPQQGFQTPWSGCGGKEKHVSTVQFWAPDSQSVVPPKVTPHMLSIHKEKHHAEMGLSLLWGSATGNRSTSLYQVWLLASFLAVIAGSGCSHLNLGGKQRLQAPLS